MKYIRKYQFQPPVHTVLKPYKDQAAIWKKGLESGQDQLQSQVIWQIKVFIANVLPCLSSQTCSWHTYTMLKCTLMPTSSRFYCIYTAFLLLHTRSYYDVTQTQKTIQWCLSTVAWSSYHISTMLLEHRGIMVGVR